MKDLKKRIIGLENDVHSIQTRLDLAIDLMIEVPPYKDSEDTKPQFPKDGWLVEVLLQGNSEWVETKITKKHLDYIIKVKNGDVRLIANHRYHWTGSVPPIKDGIKWVAFFEDEGELISHNRYSITKDINWKKDNPYDSFMLLEPMEIDL